MDDTKPSLDTDYVSFSLEGDIRSPRTPTWSPPTPSSPFDYRKFLSTPEPSDSKPQPHSVGPPPDAPLPWVWQCHLCRNRYALGVTRRCLYDGHYYCSGDASQPNLKKKKKGVACSSEFDYEGWEEYGEWRQRALKEVENPKVPRACEKCAFPSQCRTPAVLDPTKKDKKATLPVVLVAETQKKTEEATGLSITNASSDTTMTDSTSTGRSSMVDFDTILKDLIRDEEELLREFEIENKKLKESKSPERKRSGSKERNFSKKFNFLEDEEELPQNEATQSFQDSVLSMFDAIAKSRSGKGKSP